jgi:two-component system cell cycle sensor histidine kinase/response regulator CckA
MARRWWPRPSAAREAPDAEPLPETPHAVGRIDGRGLLVAANPAFLRLAGRRAAIGQHFPIVDDPGATAMVDGDIDRPVASLAPAHIGQPQLLVHIGRVAADGRRLVWLVPEAGGGDGIDARLIEASKLQAVGRLAGGVAHDFNNLLTAMLGFCDLLLARHRPGDQSFADIVQIRNTANRGAALTRQLLAFSRRQTLEPVALDLNTVLIEVSSLLRRLIGGFVRLEVETARDLGLARADQGQLEQVIVNLVVNARDAMLGAGVLTVRTRAEVLDTPQAAGPDVIPPGSYVVIEVEDTGRGIPQHLIDRLFEPFFTTKPVGEGTGLGLSTAYGIVRQLGGFITLRSTVDVGSCFGVWLPRCDEPPPRATGSVASDPVDDAPSTASILLVEDEDAVRLFAARALRAKGFRVVEAASAQSALDLVHRGRERPDLLITDVVMPGIDGVALVERLRRDVPGLAVLCISGHTDDNLRRRLEQLDGVAFLAKPFTVSHLIARIRQLMPRRDS